MEIYNFLKRFSLAHHSYPLRIRMLVFPPGIYVGAQLSFCHAPTPPFTFNLDHPRGTVLGARRAALSDEETAVGIEALGRQHQETLPALSLSWVKRKSGRAVRQPCGASGICSSSSNLTKNICFSSPLA